MKLRLSSKPPIFFLLSLLLLSFTACTPGRAAEKKRAKKQTRKQFEKGDIRFSMSHSGALRQYPPDSVHWATLTPSTDNNGPMSYYFLYGHTQALAAAQIRVEYVSRNVEGAETEIQLKEWLKGLFVNEERQGEVLDETTVLTTADGISVSLLEIHTPQVRHPSGEGLQRSAKTMAWVFIPYDGYFIGFAASATQPDEYAELKPLFFDLVRSYRRE